MAEFQLLTKFDAMGQRGSEIYVGFRKCVVNHGIETSSEIHLLVLPTWLWMAPPMLDYVLDENSNHLAEMGFERISEDDRGRILAALPLG